MTPLTFVSLSTYFAPSILTGNVFTDGSVVTSSQAELRLMTTTSH